MNDQKASLIGWPFYVKTDSQASKHMTDHIPCYYINLERSPDRRVFMEQQFAAVGVNPIRVTAFDGKRLTPKEIQNVSNPLDSQRPMNPSQIACFLSHRKVWKKVAQGKADFVAVFEDDVLLSQDIIPFLKGSGWVPNGVDCIKLEAMPFPDYQAQAEGLPFHEFALMQSFRDARATGAYILSRAAAQRLFDKTDLICGPVDMLMFCTIHPGFLGLSFRQLSPAICVQQVVAKDIRFLPPEAEISTINSQRVPAPKMKFGPGKILWELYRSIRQCSRWLVEIHTPIYYRMRHGARLTEVGFIGHPQKMVSKRNIRRAL